jgi:acyl carrier protein
LEEIESVLQQHPKVQETVVLMKEDEQGKKRLVAYLTQDPKSEKGIDDEEFFAGEMRNFLKQKLPDYMIPSAFVLLEKLPLTPNGKLDRKSLPSPDRRRNERTTIAPRTTTEEILSQIFSQILSVEKVGVNDDFFELGGHSLLATQLISRVRDLFHVELPLRNLFEAPTIAEFAKVVESAKTLKPKFVPPPIPRLSRESHRLKQPEIEGFENLP